MQQSVEAAARTENAIASPSALRSIAEWVNAPEQQLPDIAVRWARDALVDIFGCILLGMRQPATQKLLNAFDGVADGAAPIYGTDRKLDRPQAAMVNAFAGHVLDFDDWEIPGNSHPSVVLIPALLAASAGAPIKGAALIDAYAIGFEVIARMGEATNFEHYDAGWHTTGTLAAYGATAAVCRLWGFDMEQTANALSITFSRAVGYTCQFGSNAKPLQAGFAAETGVLAARLARAGLKGQHAVFEAAKGFNNLQAHGDPERFARPFAQSSAGPALAQYGLIFKVHPSCGYTHRVIDCAQALRPSVDGRLEQIERIAIHIPDFHAAILPFHQPTERSEALFSLPFCTAVTLLNGCLTLEDFHREAWQDVEVCQLIEKVSVHPFKPRRPELNYDADDPDRVDIHMNDGTVLTHAVPFPLGAPENPMSTEQLLTKFRTNVGPAIAAIEAKLGPDLDPLVNWPESRDLQPLLAVLGGYQ